MAFPLVIVASLSCATPRDPSGQRRVTDQEKREILPVVQARTSAQVIEFTREADGTIMVWTDRHVIYIVRRSGHAWKIIKKGYVTI
jgi:hypothetical protein